MLFTPSLHDFVELLRRILSSICNIPIAVMDKLRMQASIPVGYDGLGPCSVVQLAPSTFLASANAIYDLTDRLLPSNVCSVLYVKVGADLITWSSGHSQAPLITPSSFSQKWWDIPLVKAFADHPLESASNERSRAWLLACIVLVRNQAHGWMLFLCRSVIFNWMMKLYKVGALCANLTGIVIVAMRLAS